MNCKALGALLAAAMLLAGCKASNNGSSSPTRAAPSASAAPTTPRAPTPLPTTPQTVTPTPARTNAGTTGPRVGVAGQVVVSAAGFAPADITVQAGRAVTFVNADSVPHRIVSATAGVFDTGEIPPGGSASVTIASAGFTDFADAASPSHSGTITTIP